MRYGLRLLEVERPGRYEGLEAGAVVKEWTGARLKAALCFPDVYEIGMSHLGLPILYEALNREPDLLAERAYGVWPDMEALLRREKLPLVTRESGRPLSDFDLVGFTLQYELAATNVLAMLELGGVPLLARERDEVDPIVLGGGPAGANPEPLADFFDAFFIGEGEEGVVEIARTLADGLAKGLNRAARLEALGAIEGVYLPHRKEPTWEADRFTGFATGKTVKRRVVADLDTAVRPAAPMAPFGDTVHNRLAVEVTRGCTRGCRFCQAGYLYRPVREREPADIAEQIAQGLTCTGHEEVGLLSLSTGDYSDIGPLLAQLMEKYAEEKISISLPSLRLDGLDERLMAQVARVRKTGFTLAPEAGTERLRAVINKNFGDEQILDSVRKIFDAGWKKVKLYFMIGLPHETEQDRHGIVELVRKVAGIAPQGKGRVTVSISNFVPKPHTPFQWCEQLPVEEVERIQAGFRKTIPGKKVTLKLHDATMSRMEGAVARGDRRVGAAILNAYRKGCRMDGWTGEFKYDRWCDAFAEAGLDPDEFLRQRNLDEPLPWGLVDAGASLDYLRAEYEKAATREPTGDCRDGDCTGCGLCDFTLVQPKGVKRHFTYPEPKTVEADEPQVEPPQAIRVRFSFAKTGPAALLSHLETTAALHRALRCAGVPLQYSQGFNPHPKLQLGPAMPLGTESTGELGEFRVVEMFALSDAHAALNRHLPEGLIVEGLWRMGPESKTLSGGNTREEYRLCLTNPARAALQAKGGWDKVIDDFWAAGTLPVVKRRKNKPDRVLEAFHHVRGLRVEGEELVVRLARNADGGGVAPELFLRTLLGLDETVRAGARVLKTRMEFL